MTRAHGTRGKKGRWVIGSAAAPYRWTNMCRAPTTFGLANRHLVRQSN